MDYGTPMKIKRRNPFGEEDYRTNKNVKNDMETIYERTLRMLKQGGKPSHSHKAADFIEVRQCQRCSEKGELIPCSYCSREICNSCVMQCERCQETFCTACSTINYDMRYDRVFCHTCNDEEQVEARGRQNKSMINSNNAPYVMSKV